MNTERWDYKIDGKKHGLLRIFVMLGITVFFSVLAIDQLLPGDNKYWQMALAFGFPAVMSAIVVIRLLVRYLCFKIYMGSKGFYMQTTPFDGMYYRYSQAKYAGEELKRYRRRGSGSSYVYYFNIILKNGDTKRIIFDKSLYEREFNVLKERINCANNTHK